MDIQFVPELRYAFPAVVALLVLLLFFNRFRLSGRARDRYFVLSLAFLSAVNILNCLRTDAVGLVLGVNALFLIAMFFFAVKAGSFVKRNIKEEMGLLDAFAAKLKATPYPELSGHAGKERLQEKVKGDATGMEYDLVALIEWSAGKPGSGVAVTACIARDNAFVLVPPHKRFTAAPSESAGLST